MAAQSVQKSSKTLLFTKLQIEFGTVPDNLLPCKSNSVKLASWPLAMTGMRPFSWLLSAYKSRNDEANPKVVGILPVSKLLERYNRLRLVNSKRPRGIVPVSLLLVRSNTCKGSCEMTSGMLPEKEFSLRPSISVGRYCKCESILKCSQWTDYWQLLCGGSTLLLTHCTITASQRDRQGTRQFVPIEANVL